MGKIGIWDAPKRPVISKKPSKYPEKLGKMPHGTEDQNILADELIEWALKEDSLLLERFPLSKKISPYRFFRLCKSGKNDYLTRALEFARAACSVRQIEGDHKIDTSIVLKLLRVYNTEYHESLLEIEDRAIEAKKIVGGNEDVQFVVNMEPSKSNLQPCSVINIENKINK